MSAEDEETGRGRNVAVAVLITTVLVVFGRVCGNDFVSWDDTTFITTDPALLHPTLGSLASIWRSPELGLYIPLPYTIWWAVAHIGLVDDGNGGIGLNPWLFHPLNLLAHIAAVLLVLELFRQLGLRLLPAAIGASIFGLHPLAAEPVAWLMGFRDILSADFVLLTLILFARGRTFAATGFMVIAVLCKPTAIMVMPMAIAIDWLYFDKPLIAGVRRSLPLLAVAILGALETLLYGLKIFEHITSPWQRPLIALDAIAFYAFKWAAPVGLAIDYARNPQFLFASSRIFWVAAITAVSVFAILLSQRKRLILIALLFILPLLPVIGLVPFSFETLSTVADHYMYLSLLAPALAVALILQACPWRFITVGSVIFAVALGILSLRQAGFWQNDTTLFRHAADVQPLSPVAWNGLAAVDWSAGDLPSALADEKRAVAANPDFTNAHVALVIISAAMGNQNEVQLQLDEVDRCARQSLNYDPAVLEKLRAKYAMPKSH